MAEKTQPLGSNKNRGQVECGLIEGPEAKRKRYIHFMDNGRIPRRGTELLLGVEKNRTDNEQLAATKPGLVLGRGRPAENCHGGRKTALRGGARLKIANRGSKNRQRRGLRICV